MAAQGVPLGTVLAIEAGPMSDVLAATVSALDRVHGDGKLGTIAVKQRGRGSTLGLYTAGSPPSIEVKKGQAEPGLTLLHEVGHLLDDTGIEPGKSWRTLDSDPRLAPWWEAVKKSALFAYFVKLTEQTRMRVPREWGRAYEYATIEHSKVRDRLDPRELFARSYAQYVVVESGDPVLRAELNHAREGRHAIMYPEHWPDEDFEPIRVAMDNLVRSLGWRT